MPAFPGCRRPFEGLGEAFQLLLDARLDGIGALGELGEHVGGNIGHLGDAVHRLAPAHTEPPRQLGAQARVVEAGEGLLIALDRARVEGQPATVGRQHPVDDDHVGVQLGVEGATGVLAEEGGGDPLGVEGADVAVDAVATMGVAFDPVDHRRHRRVVAGQHFVAHVVVAEREEHRRGLRRRARDVEAAHGPVGVGRAEQSAGARIDAGHQVEEAVLVHRAFEAEVGRAGAAPHPGRLSPVEVIAELVLDVVAARVGAAQGRRPRRHGSLPHEGVHSSVRECDASRVGG